MKRIFYLFAFVVTLITLGITPAKAQISIGADGIKFDDDYDSKNSVTATTIISYNTKKNSLTIGTRAASTIPAFEIGWNTLSNVGYSAYKGGEYGDFFDIRNWKSTQVTVNFLDVGVYSKKAKVGFSLGIGIRANNYRFDSNLTLAKQNGIIIPQYINQQDATLPGPYTPRSVKKSKFNIASVHIPMEIIFGQPNELAFSVGGYVDMVMNSHTKIKYQGGRKEKVHNFPTNFIQAGVVARLSFYKFSIFCSYQPTQLFKTGRGPESRQWTIGIGF